MNLPNSPSQHIDDEQIFEYLDQALTQKKRAEFEAHLDNCQICIERLEKHTAIFTAIEGIPDQTLERDLAPEVLSALKKGKSLSPIWWWLLGIQGILALGLMALTAPSLLNSSIEIPFREMGRDVLTTFSTNISAWLQVWNSLLENSRNLFEFDFSPILGIPTQSILWLLLLATLTWIVGNSILLRPRLTQLEQ